MIGFTLGIVQMRVEPGKKLKNIDRAVGMIQAAVSKGAQVVVLPEALPLGWAHPAARNEAEIIPKGQWCRILAETARKSRIWICSGVIERSGDNIFNSAVLFDDRGKVALLHRKINELDIAHDLYAQGDRLSVVDTPFGRMGLMICADAFAKGHMISRTLGMMGARVILSPCSWTTPADHELKHEPYGALWLNNHQLVARIFVLSNYQPVACEFGTWIAGVSNVGPVTDGPWSGRKCIGCSLVVGPTGEVAHQGPYGESAEHVGFALIAPGTRPGPWPSG